MLRKSSFIGLAAIFAACANTPQDADSTAVQEVSQQFERPAKTLVLGFEVIEAERGYELQSNSEGTWNVFGGKSHQSINWHESIHTFNGPGSFQLERQSAERIYFAAVSASQDTVLFANRHFVLDGPVNFRDIGGLTTKDGKTVKWGSIFRSDKLSKLTDDDRSVMADLGIAMDIDFRQEYEISKDPDAISQDGSITYINLPMGDTSGGNPMVTFFNMLREFDGQPEKLENAFVSMYSKLLSSNVAQYKEYFRLLDTQEGPLLFHCTAGSDRTGIASALLLYTLGVDMEDIKKEYLLTSYYRYEETLAMKGMFEQYGLSDSTLELFKSLKPEYLEAVLAVVYEEYGNLDQFMELGLGVDAEMKNRLIEKYTF